MASRDGVASTSLPNEVALPEGSEIAWADMLVEMEGWRICCVPGRGFAVHDSKNLWRFVKDGTIFEIVRKFLPMVAENVEKEAAKNRICSWKTAKAVLEFVRNDSRIQATSEMFDHDDYALGTPIGVIDLKTGRRRQRRPEDRITKITAVDPGGECPIWLRLIEQATGGDAEKAQYMQRLSGYILTGSTREQILSCVFGPGGTGKSLIWNTIMGIMGDYATTIPMETLISSKNDQHPTGQTMLANCRFGVANETEQGRSYNESFLKSATGGDQMTARYIGKDYFVFRPKIKLMIIGNHKPSIKNLDDAMRRRIQILPMTAKVPPDQKDLDLAERLKPEWPGILKWMIEGCLEWQRDGLRPPAAVTSASSDYFETQDVIESWISECGVKGPGQSMSSSGLYASWQAWARNAGEFVGSNKHFSEKLADRGYIKRKDGQGRMIFYGLSASVPMTDTHRWQD